ncbi:molybdenum ABC transporter, periplasmic molybdate-binding protein [Candidatus Koribacter versatilis Ellin345]|uniref:Molybdenum ABC transporter, periplasmic molybdate-binding protein n=1 Tax=Koribacter versatilis (strain Ellin345) TaxID=204669 RepID=Q1IR25_KORVE|nr:molybdate ABC transporter substrate-binding protein [Candidatus Koribacter versatilis]ABF40675.1 molybdenum ABC transporter, periplasmic molybdate-binding protein [Candidatus Koribacter versatilis Ellin345]
MKYVFFTLLLAATISACAQEIRVAAASDLSSVMPDLAKKFDASSSCKTIVSFGSSGNFYQQLQSAAPFDVFLSADKQYPQKLQDAGLTLPGTLTEYASGKLVLWARKESHLDLSKGLKALTATTVKRIAIANPQHAPYGRAAIAALNTAGVYDKISAKLVFGENVSQTAVFAQSGNADAGLIPLSLALTASMKSAGNYVEIPTPDYPPIRQAAVAMKNSRNADCAKRFVTFLTSTDSKQLLQQFGFSTN